MSNQSLREAAQRLLKALDDFMYMNDYSGLEVSKHDQPTVTGEMEAMRAALAQPDDPTDPGHDVNVLREHVRHLERRVRQLHAENLTQPDDKTQPAASSALGEVIGCFEAALVEGLQEALASTEDERLKDLVERRLMYALYAAQNAAPQQAASEGWLEAAVAWEVCASVHEKWAKGKDALYTTRHNDFVRHAEDARARHAAAPQPPAEQGEYTSCKGMNCGCTDGFSHSLECLAEHAAAIAGGKFVKPAEQGAELSDEQINEGGALLEYAAKWLNRAPHGDNCFVSDHYEGDPGDRCNCGKDSLLAAIEAYLAAHGSDK